MEHPRKSTCDCPLANGKKIICKHIVAVSLCLDESEADRFKNEKTIYASEEDETYASVDTENAPVKSENAPVDAPVKLKNVLVNEASEDISIEEKVLQFCSEPVEITMLD